MPQLSLLRSLIGRTAQSFCLWFSSADPALLLLAWHGCRDAPCNATSMSDVRLQPKWDDVVDAWCVAVRPSCRYYIEKRALAGGGCAMACTPMSQMRCGHESHHCLSGAAVHAGAPLASISIVKNEAKLGDITSRVLLPRTPVD
jgi:hypothetical protein